MNFKKKRILVTGACGTIGSEITKKLLDLGAFFSASGIITFKNSIGLQNTFRNIPLDKILIETDSPYLAPIPMRGKKNEPSFIKYTLEKLSTLREISTEKMSTVTTNNFNRLFNT